MKFNPAGSCLGTDLHLNKKRSFRITYGVGWTQVDVERYRLLQSRRLIFLTKRLAFLIKCSICRKCQSEARYETK